ncbi:hypothetical protein GCM10025886_14020 [Tetragenococcus halophilus subsp. flandriensis]|uniref:DUF961 family protein n=1 Tax=Tetragenococcus halophilus TaxID=51669 RepID=UPI0023E952F2|nr:DUF961 family protein [Tetragenococcus halophilus]GMA08251.1 hypothetical protein GCM10025886_14020 [Tetragenococcus halophilus subsp. flandriensis]
MKIRNEDLVVDVNGTFGDLFFVGLARESYEYEYDEDQERNINTGEIIDKRYEVISSAQQSYFNVIVPPTIDVDFDQNTLVELVNPRFDPYNVGRGNMDIRVLADNIVKKGQTAEPVNKSEPKKEEQKVEAGKKDDK